MSLSGKCILEISELSDQARRLARGSAKDRAEAAVLAQRITNLRTQRISSDEALAKYAEALNAEVAPRRMSEKRYREAFLKYISASKSEGEAEMRDVLAGQQSIVYTAGPALGYTVPLDTEKEVFEAITQTEPLLSENACHFTMEPSPTLQPQVLDGYDLSTVAAMQILESAQQTAGTFPTVAGRTLRGNIIFKLTFGYSIEAETDIPALLSKIARAMGVGFARELGQQSILGNGTTGMQGLLTALPTPVYTTGTGKITLTDINAIYFSVNRIYRAQPKCAWLMSDSVYQRLRNAVDSSGRPLLNVRDDQEVLMNKPIYVCPSLPALAGGSLTTNSTVVFGDLDHYHVRCSRPTLQRVTQSSIADITQGKAAAIARIRADAAVFDPSNGSAPPLVTATVTY